MVFFLSNRFNLTPDAVVRNLKLFRKVNKLSMFLCVNYISNYTVRITIVFIVKNINGFKCLSVLKEHHLHAL